MTFLFSQCRSGEELKYHFWWGLFNTWLRWFWVWISNNADWHTHSHTRRLTRTLTFLLSPHTQTDTHTEVPLSPHMQTDTHTEVPSLSPHTYWHTHSLPCWHVSKADVLIKEGQVKAAGGTYHIVSIRDAHRRFALKLDLAAESESCVRDQKVLLVSERFGVWTAIQLRATFSKYSEPP